jgi:hypothetical protein
MTDLEPLSRSRIALLLIKRHLNSADRTESTNRTSPKQEEQNMTTLPCVRSVHPGIPDLVPVVHMRTDDFKLYLTAVRIQLALSGVTFRVNGRPIPKPSILRGDKALVLIVRCLNLAVRLLFMSFDCLLYQLQKPNLHHSLSNGLMSGSILRYLSGSMFALRVSQLN